MALTTYSELKTAISTWSARTGDTDYVARAPDIVTLAEAKLNRLFGALDADATLTGTVSSRRITTGLTIQRPIALWLAEANMDEQRVQLQADGTFPYLTSSGRPSMAALDEGGTYLDFDCPLDAAYPFRLRYVGRIALSDSVTTNWLLTNHPDVYLAACMMWGAGYKEDWPNGAQWAGLLNDAIPEIQKELAGKKRGTLRVDPALQASAGFSLAQWTNGG